MALVEDLELKVTQAFEFGSVSELVVFEGVEAARVAFDRDSASQATGKNLNVTDKYDVKSPILHCL